MGVAAAWAAIEPSAKSADTKVIASGLRRIVGEDGISFIFMSELYWLARACLVVDQLAASVEGMIQWLHNILHISTRTSASGDKVSSTRSEERRVGKERRSR